MFTVHAVYSAQLNTIFNDPFSHTNEKPWVWTNLIDLAWVKVKFMNDNDT